MILRRTLLGATIATLLLSPPAFCKVNTTSLGRYLMIKQQATAAQQQLWRQRIQIKFPSNILTLQDAVHFVLRFSGYHLAQKQPKTIQALLQQPLPEIDRQLTPMPLSKALRTLLGPETLLLIDPVHRLVGFAITPNYRALY